jgi:uncharacterized protein with HEPN domain
VKDDLLYVEHILECIERVEDYCGQGERAFFAQRIIQDAVLRNLQLLAESSKRLSEVTKSGHPEVDWRGVAGFRNVLVHDYLNVNLRRAWEIVSLDLPVLRKQMEAIRAGLPGPA